MRKPMRTILATGFLGVATLGHVLIGCTNRLGPVVATQTEGRIDRPNLPDGMVIRSRDCVAEYGLLLVPGHHEFSATVRMNEDGDKEDVTIDGIPNSAHDLGACLRNALRAMPIAKEPLRHGVETLKYQREHASEEQLSLADFINVISGVPIVVSQLVFEAQGYTIVLPVAVKVVAKPETFINGDNRTMAKVGRLAIDTLGYDEIITRAEQMGWVKTVRFEQAQSTAEKKFIGDVPPTSSAVVEAAFKRVMTRAAPAALLASQTDSPAPGPGDLVAVGILAVGLLAVGAISAYEIIATEDTPVTTTPAPASAAQPKATTAPPVPAPRRYAGQTCENVELDRLEDEKDKICKPEGGFAAICKGDHTKPKFAKIPCSAIKLAIQQRQACKAARELIQDKCFGGKPDPGHKTAIDQEQNAVNACEALKLLNCAKGHPMAGR
ncbi:MAG: hypothetical protein IPM54_37025 [Polyangiaceae bacterium]|nr:hypothetical protein [Polyangiaceae bacterium]